MDTADALAAAREILPLLPTLVNPETADELALELQLHLLNAKSGDPDNSAAQIRELLNDVVETKRWMAHRDLKAEVKQRAAVRALQDVEPRKYEEVWIQFASDRKCVTDAKGRVALLGDRASNGSVTYGMCHVSIPATHGKGRLETPWLRGEFWQSPAKHIVLMKVEVQEKIGWTPEKALKTTDALVFIHGFNVTFQAAATRTAQIASDLKFQGVPILYSWPSVGRLHSYVADDGNVNWTVPHLRIFLEQLVEEDGIHRIHLIAHSMGARPLVRVLKELSGSPAIRAKCHEVVFAAPDIDADELRECGSELNGTANRFTLYASATDLPLIISTRIHRYRRAGDAADEVLVMDGVDSVDATGADTSLLGRLLGHSYFGKVRGILSDIYQLLQGVPARDRSDLKIVAGAFGSYFRYVP